MILVDTNVWSELMRPAPDERVRAWDHANANATWLSTVVLGELLSGVALMPNGQRKIALERGYETLIAIQADRIVSFDLEASRQYARVLAHQVEAGRNPGTADTQIAATALARGMALATRNTRHFEGLGLKLIDPWFWQD
jgi:predicted nucleic acid-binding protein